MLVLGVLATFAAGCNRAHYRRQADRDVYGLVDCASTDPRWPLDNYTIEPDPRSRFFDPDSPDRPPMPPDDPTSHRLIHCVDGKCGWPYEGRYGCTPYVENPEWEAVLSSYLPCKQDGTVVLDRQGAMLAALLHSRDYQQKLENLYLSALDVSLERFQFDTQFFLPNSTDFSVDGPLSGKANSSSTLSADTRPRAERLLATGGQLAVEVANQVLWQFSGDDGYSVTTPLRFAFLQPLLRRAGRAVWLENLTDSERALLASVREMERFRREFYIQTVAGRGAGVGGYLSLLQQQLEIRNQRANVAALRDSLERLDAFLKTGQTNPVQVDQTRQSLYDSQISLLSRSTNYQDQLDSYKIQLGLPPRLPVSIEDRLLDPFDLIDPGLTETQNKLADVLKPVREGAAAVDNALEAAEATTRATQTAQASQAVIRAAEAAAEAIADCKGNDYAQAAKAASSAVAQAQAAVAAAEAAEAEALAQAAGAAAEAGAEAATAAEAGDQAKAIEAAANSTTRAAEGAARAAAEVAAETARAAVKSAQATGTAQPAEAAAVAAEAARAAATAVDRAELGDYAKAAEAAVQAAARATGAVTTAADTGELDDSGKVAEAAAEAARAVQAAQKAMETNDPSQYADAVEAAVHAALAAVEATLAAVKPEDTAAQTAAQEAAHTALAAVEAALAAAKAEVALGDVALAAREAADAADYADELTRAALAAVEAALAGSKADDVAQSAVQAAQATAEDAATAVLGTHAPALLQTAIEGLRAVDDQQNSILDAARNHVALVEQDSEKLLGAREQRQRQLEELSNRPEFQRGEVDPGVCDVDALNRRVVAVRFNLYGKRDADVKQLARDLLRTPADREWFEARPNINGLANDLPATTDELERFLHDAPQLAVDAGEDLNAWHDLLGGFRDLLDNLSSELADLSLVQARARLETTTLTPVELDSATALDIARANRRDWMNARAALVDQWRQIELAANDLKSKLDLTVSGDVTPTSNTLSGVHNTTGNITVGLAFDAPLTRRAERNVYRRRLIEYQQARREYYAFEDGVSQDLRETLRSIHLTPLQFELQRAAVHTAITRTERQQYYLRMGRATSGPTAARDLVDAFGALLRAQNSFLGIWLEYEVLRMHLDFNLGTMQLDDRGMWIDPGPVNSGDLSPPEGYEVIPAGPELLPLPEPALPIDDEILPQMPEIQDVPSAHDADRPPDRLAIR